MQVNKDFSVALSISAKRFMEKPKRGTFRKEMDTWNNVYYSVSTIQGMLQSGYAYVGGVFRYNKRKDDNFIMSNIISIDIDDATVDMKAFTSNLPLHPTFSYTTWSNNPAEGIYRFRLVYVFDKEICDKEDYKALYTRIVDVNGIHTKDACGAKVSQIMYGNPNGEFLSWNLIYSWEDFHFVPVIDDAPGAQIQPGIKSVTGIFLDKKGPEIKINQNLYDYLMSDSFNFLAYMEANKETCSVKEKGKIPYNELGYGIYPEGYAEVVHRWTFDSDLKKRTKLLRKNGQRRRKHLYLDALKAIWICPALKYYQYNLCYQICHQAYYYCVHDDEKEPITGKDIAGILYNALNTDINDPRLAPYLISDKVGHYTADRLWCELHGKDHRYYWRTGKKIDSRNWIATWYNQGKTLKENFENQPATGNPCDGGKKVSLRTLKRYCEEKGIEWKNQLKPKIRDIYRPGLKLEDARAKIKEMGLKISRSSVYDYYRQNNINPKTGYEYGKLL